MKLKLFLLMIALLTAPLTATSYVMMRDDVLADQARLVLVGNVERVESIASNPPYTRFHVRPERLLKGRFDGDTVAVDVLGGVTPGGRRLVLFGSPSFSTNDRLILFLVPRNNGSYGVLHVGLGAFREFRVGNQIIARQLLGAAVEVEPTTADSGRFHQPRDFESFANWLGDYSRGIRRPMEYFVDTSRQDIPPGSSFRLSGDPGRHDKFDKGETVEWVAFQGGQTGLNGGGTAELEEAFEAWNADLRTNIDMELTGTTASNPGIVQDGVNNISFDDPTNEVQGTYTCPGGGVLGFGGAFVGTPLHEHRGESFFTALETFVVMNDGVECVFSAAGGPALAAQVYAHEIGHALLIAHSCGQFAACTDPEKDDALMRAQAHSDGRRARLGIDDRRAIAKLYTNPTEAFAAAIFPQYINGLIGATPNSTRVIARNNGTQADSGRINFQDGDGNPQAVPVSISGSAPAGSATFVAFNIPPGGVFDVETAGTGGLVSGSVEIVSNLGAASKLEATEAFSVLGNFVSVPSATLAAIQQVFVSFNAAENTGFAAYNPNPTVVNFTVSLINGAGNPQANEDLSINPGQRIAIFVDDASLFGPFLPSVGNNFTGTMNITTLNGEVLAVLGLLQKKASGALIAVETSTNAQHPEP